PIASLKDALRVRSHSRTPPASSGQPVQRVLSEFRALSAPDANVLRRLRDSGFVKNQVAQFQAAIDKANNLLPKRRSSTVAPRDDVKHDISVVADSLAVDLPAEDKATVELAVVSEQDLPAEAEVAAELVAIYEDKLPAEAEITVELVVGSEDALPAITVTQTVIVEDDLPAVADSQTVVVENAPFPVSDSTEDEEVHDWTGIAEKIKSDSMMVAEYHDEIVEYLRGREREMMPDPRYIGKQYVLNWRTRYILINWVVRAHDELGMKHEALLLAVNIIDRYLSNHQAPTIRKLQLFGATALWLACKYEDRANELKVKVILRFVGTQGWTAKDVCEMELAILAGVGFDL
ncbi:B-type cyclin, partial [Coemansia aciculifera]